MGSSSLLEMREAPSIVPTATARVIASDATPYFRTLDASTVASTTGSDDGCSRCMAPELVWWDGSMGTPVPSGRLPGYSWLIDRNAAAGAR